VPTGVPIRNIREQLFSAAERVLLRNGPDALTSRAVTAEAGVAKGILHRHFPDFDAFLAAFVLSRIDRVEAQSAELRASAGNGALDHNLASALAEALDPLATGMAGLVCCRRVLLERLRLTTPTGIPLFAEITKMISAYLTAERGLGRLPLSADVDTIAVLLVGGAHLLAAPNNHAPGEQLHSLVRTTLQSLDREKPRSRTPQQGTPSPS